MFRIDGYWFAGGSVWELSGILALMFQIDGCWLLVCGIEIKVEFELAILELAVAGCWRFCLGVEWNFSFDISSKRLLVAGGF
ncbi:MAG: hypothetical protein V9E88_05095 [Ferruginibacter sp.]